MTSSFPTRRSYVLHAGASVSLLSGGQDMATQGAWENGNMELDTGAEGSVGRIQSSRLSGVHEQLQPFRKFRAGRCRALARRCALSLDGVHTAQQYQGQLPDGAWADVGCVSDRGLGWSGSGNSIQRR